MKVSVVVMAHPRREAFVPSILEALDAPAVVVWDTMDSLWQTGRTALLAADPTSDYAVILQDDSIPCRDLVAGLELALPHVPDGSPVGLYVGRQRPMRSKFERAIAAAEQASDSWVVYDGPLWGVGVVLPTDAIEETVDHCDRMATKSYDHRLYRHFTSLGLPCYYTHPSLVEHRNSPSLVPGRASAGRVAHRFIGANASATDVDWSRVPTQERMEAVRKRVASHRERIRR